jgi:hypothetical protein
VPVQKRVRVPDESGHEVRHDPDILASSPDRYSLREGSVNYRLLDTLFFTYINYLCIG